MSWNRTYSHTLALGLDRFTAALLFNQADITVSSLCWIVMTHDQSLTKPGLTMLDLSAVSAFRMMKMYPWQVVALRWIGARLEEFFPGHCAEARQGDINTSERSRMLLGVSTNGALLPAS